VGFKERREEAVAATEVELKKEFEEVTKREDWEEAKKAVEGELRSRPPREKLEPLGLVLVLVLLLTGEFERSIS
jgi:hypothetical protein